MTELSTLVTASLEEAIASIRRSVRRRGTDAQRSQRVAEALAPFLGRPDLLTDLQKVGDERDYRQHLLHVEPGGSFSVVSLVWLPGQATPIHDHLSWCVVGVYEGTETEVSYVAEERSGMEVLVPVERSDNGPGSTSALAPPGDIHEVRNASAEKAVSLHVYGADIGLIGSSIRRRYELPTVQGRYA